MASSLPSHASVVVIGGGIMGCSTLFHLAKMGVTDAVLVERNMGPESARIAAKLGCRKHARAWYNCNRRAGV